MLVNLRGGLSRAGTWLHPSILLFCHHLQGASVSQCTDFGSSWFRDDEERDDPQNIGLLTIQPPDSAASLKIF
jgi:hypothetical protein